MNINKNILITGSNRSGSTWVGNVISSNTKVDNIIEPLNLNRIKRFKRIELDYWYPRIDESSPENLKSEIVKLMGYYLKTSYKNVFSDVFEQYEGHNLLQSAKKRWRRSGKPVKMLKDPTAIFCVPWLVSEFKLKPVILIRHPAAYALSIKEKNWWFNFENFSKQPLFFSEELQPLEAEVLAFQERETKKDIIENAALLWKVFYTQVLMYQKNYPEWFYITHEELSLDPVFNFERLFDYLELEFNTSVKRYITESTQSNVSGEFKRDSAENTLKWQKKLSEQEKTHIFNITHSVSDHFYETWV